MTISTTTFTDGVKFTGGGDGETASAIVLGGEYGIGVYAGTWGGGTVDFQILLPDGSTYMSVLDTPYSDDSSDILTLPPGTYRFSITTSTSVQGFLIASGND